MRREPRTVAITVTDGTHPFEVAVACEVFGFARPEVGVDWYRFLVCTAGDGPVDAHNFTLASEFGLDDLAAADTVIVPAAPTGDAPVEPALVDALRAAYERGARMVSYCSGSFALAAAGVLDGRRATTHWLYADELARRYPEVQVVPDVLYVEDGPVFTSAGTSAGIDLSLHIVRLDYGSDIANAVARRMVVPPHRDGGQAQYVDLPVPTVDDGVVLGPTLDWIADHLDEPLTVDTMAMRAMVSTRTFARHFRAVTGTTPLQWLLHQRVRHARRLLETTTLSVDHVASACGLGSAANLRVHFRRAVGIAPNAYRRTFTLGLPGGTNAS
ncbi:MAG: helix-turn-helix protein [Actinomycetia bacterium]|nr:helix-turn-helix protein [Actinomycetes bacterium]